MPRMKKGKNGSKDALESLQFIIKHMATKEEVRDIVKEEVAGAEKRLTTKIEDVDKKLAAKIEGVDSKINGTNRRLDTEAMQRMDLKLPRRMHDVEIKVFGASKHPKALPF